MWDLVEPQTKCRTASTTVHFNTALAFNLKVARPYVECVVSAFLLSFHRLSFGGGVITSLPVGLPAIVLAPAGVVVGVLLLGPVALDVAALSLLTFAFAFAFAV